MKKLLNFEYACIQGTYWMYYAVICSFSSVFLLAHGFSNSEIGIIMAAANILAVVLQPIMADIADRSKRISVIGISEIITVFMMVMTVGLFAFTGRTLALALTFILLISWHTVLQPFCNSLAFKLEKSGVAINFGLTRSLGSLTFSALVAVLGTLVESFGTITLPVTGELVLIMLLASFFFTKRQYDKAYMINHSGTPAHDKESTAVKEKSDEEEINLLEFIKGNKSFFVVNIGVLGLYFSNSVLNNYMMQIVANIGGNSEDMGRVLSLMAFLEIPTMVFFGFLKKKFSCRFLLQVASVGFALKIFLCHIATSVAMLFVAQIAQLFSFALFLPAMVHFINEIMRKGEAVKGQALFTTMITVTTVFSSLVGGIILDVSGAKMLTFTSTAATFIGAAIVILTLKKIPNHDSD